MKYYSFDLDGTLCYTPNGNDYFNSKPLARRIERVNNLYDTGNHITIYTARGCRSGLSDTIVELTKEQLEKWGVKHHELSMGNKIFYDILIDDKVINVIDWDKEEQEKIGIIAGTFDLIHPGYILLFQDAKKVCDKLLILLHDDPSKERMNKFAPVHNLLERKIILESIKYVDEIKIYKTEEELFDLLKEHTPHVRILGTDYKNKNYTGKEIKNHEIYFHERTHDWSYSNLRNKIITIGKK